MADQVGNAMGEGAGLAATGTGHHQQGAGVVIDGPALGVVKSGKEGTHGGIFAPGGQVSC